MKIMLFIHCLICTIHCSTGQSDLNDHLLSHLMGKIKKTIPRKKVKVKTSSSKQKPSRTKSSAKKPPHIKCDTTMQPGLTKESNQPSHTMSGEEQPSVDDSYTQPSFNKPSRGPPSSHDYRVLKNRNIRFTKKCLLCKGLPFTTYSVSPRGWATFCLILPKDLF